MTFLHVTPFTDDCLFYTLSVLIFWAMPTTFFTDFWKKDYWKSKVNRFFNISMATFFILELAILLYEHVK